MCDVITSIASLIYGANKVIRPHSKRPIGQPTRGKTALNRLRQVDVYFALAHAGVLRAGAPLVVDVGYGAQAWTALELYERWLPLNPRLRLIGVEIDAARVAAALPYGQAGVIDFRLGGFNVAHVLNGEKARVIRAYNVLRQYDEAAVPDALVAMGAGLETGGLLIEGTSTPTGRIVAFDVYRKAGDGGLQHRELVFGTNFREAVDPAEFQTILPKRLIHHMLDDRPAAFFHDWRRAVTLAVGRGLQRERAKWAWAARALHERFGWAVDMRERIVRRGYLVLRDKLE